MQNFDFCPNLIKFYQIYRNLHNFYPNLLKFYPNFDQIGINFTQIYLKKLARVCDRIPGYNATAHKHIDDASGTLRITEPDSAVSAFEASSATLLKVCGSVLSRVRLCD